ncbi:AT-rich interactive domain-containing protein 2-like isoform X2 [Durio zibethinus]|nr:AT-rich interactive domain-containing protein 2-like isoform X2 [Durio zibethinus]
MKDDGSSLDCAKTLEKPDPAGSWIDLEPFSKVSFLKSEPHKVRFWFNKFLGSFLKEIYAQGCFFPLPPMLGDGQPVDLFKLFFVVKEKGGCDAVSESGLWDLVAKESGLGSNVASSVKLVYVKYLVSVERWLERIVQSEDSKSESNYSGHMMELGEELKGFLLASKKKVLEYSQVEESVVAGSEGGEKCVKDEESMHIDLTKRILDYKEVERLRNDDDLNSVVVDSDGDKKFIYVDENEDTPSDLAKSVVNALDVEQMCNEDEVKSAIMEDCVECKTCTFSDIDDDDDDDDVAILDSNDIKETFSSHKRKRDSTWGILNWVKEIAKDPCDPAVGSLPERSKWKSYGSEEVWKQVLLFREAAFHGKDDHSSADQSNWQKNQKMHPCMYDDHTKFGYNLRERLSCTKTLPLGRMASKGQDCSQSSSGNRSDLDSSMVGIDKQLHGTCDSTTPGSAFDYNVDIHVPIGPYFQVEVPDWTGVASESDAKWLGTRVWPLEKKEHRFLIERDPIGKGRQDSCGCPIQNSLQCVKFHVAEKRLKVRLELGSAFSQWKFDKMGEEVALAWKEEEQKTFSSIAKSNPSLLEKSFWDDIYKHFPNKSREELVCYYYNVFLLQRRAYQNRITPSNINSDDDEPEAESIAKGIRHEAIKPYTSILISPKKSRI